MTTHLPSPSRSFCIDGVWFWTAGCTCGWRAADQDGDPHLVDYAPAVEHSMNHVRRKVAEGFAYDGLIVTGNDVKDAITVDLYDNAKVRAELRADMGLFGADVYARWTAITT